jgi:uncharacterized protein (DUF952 family)
VPTSDSLLNLFKNPPLIYHFTTTELWDTALNRGLYSHPSLKTEGFIHCSTSYQLEGTLAKHFADAEEIILLHIVEKRVKNWLKYEQFGNADAEYPHLYCPIPMAAIENISILNRGTDNEWENLPVIPMAQSANNDPDQETNE